MDDKHAIAALGALAQETRLALFRLLVTCGPAGLLSVPVLFPGTGSVTPAGGVTVAVLISAPVVPAGTPNSTLTFCSFRRLTTRH